MTDPHDMFQFTADRGDARLRLDQVLVRRGRDAIRLSRHVAQRWIQSGAVTVAGRLVRRCSAGVAEGAEIVVTLPDTARLRIRPAAESGDLDLLYEDEAILAVNKPAGVVVHPTYKTTSGTLLNRLLWHFRDRPQVQPSILTRLDKGTSGLVLVALRPEIHAAIQRHAAAQRVRKEYLAVVAGVPVPPAGAITLALARDPGDRRRVIALATGAPAHTAYDVVASGGGVSSLRCELLTGRTHQIRVHLAAMGWPLLGDATYGVPHAGLTRQALHARRITLTHPVTGVRVQIAAPLPDDIARVLP
jgi:23S rRNA pseudouridine1911/1915/1917 synthase